MESSVTPCAGVPGLAGASLPDGASSLVETPPSLSDWVHAPPSNAAAASAATSTLEARTFDRIVVPC